MLCISRVMFSFCFSCFRLKFIIVLFWFSCWVVVVRLLVLIMVLKVLKWFRLIIVFFGC